MWTEVPVPKRYGYGQYIIGDPGSLPALLEKLQLTTSLTHPGKCTIFLTSTEQLSMLQSKIVIIETIRIRQLFNIVVMSEELLSIL